MSNIIERIRSTASSLAVRRAVHPPGSSGCGEGLDPSPVLELLAMPRQGSTGADLADAYQSAGMGKVAMLGDCA